MNKTIIININSIVFHIEEDAYETLRSYMIEIKRHFGNSEDSREILEDIENRIAEMFSERIQTGRKEVINREDVDQVIAQMGRVSDFDVEIDDEPRAEAEPKAAFADHTEQSGSQQEESKEHKEQTADFGFTEYLTSKKLMRDMDDKVLSGVCSGLGHYFNIEAKWVRIIFVLFFLFGGSGVLLYFVLWAVMPKATTRADKLAMRGEQANLHNFKKSFDEEMKGVRENFSGAGEHISRGARSVGNSLGSIFSVIGKILGVLVLIWAGLSIIGMFIFFVFNVLNIMGYKNDIFFDPLEVLDPTSAFFAILAGCAAIIIPLLAIFFIMLRVVFKTRPMNNYASMSLLAAWIVSIVMILYFVVVTNQDTNQESTISVEKTIEPKDTYILSENDIRVIKTTDEDFNNNRENGFKVGSLVGNYLREDISVSIEPLDSLKAPYLQYNYFAKGGSYADASNRAGKINYSVKQEDNNIYFNSHFTLQEKQLIRAQHVHVNLFLPVGTKVIIDDNLSRKLDGIETWKCKAEKNSKTSEWIMTKSGLKCILKLEEEKAKAEEERLEELKEQQKEKEEKAKEEADEKKKDKTEATSEDKESSTVDSNA